MPLKILTVTLNPAIDRIVHYDGVSRSTVSLAGGKGVNVARTLRALAVPARAIAVAGGVSGKLLDALLDEENIAHILLPVKGLTRTNSTVVGKDGVVRRKLGPGPVLTKKERDAFKAIYLREIKGAHAVVFSGSLPLKFPVKEFAEMVSRAKCPGCMSVVDTRGPALASVLDLGVDVIKPNRQEAEDVLGFKLSSRSMIRKALRTFIRCGIKKVLISLGEQGIVASDGSQELWVRVPVLKTGHTVGCGDAALAGFLSAHFKANDFSASVAYAAACGYANVLAGRPGCVISKNIQHALTRRKIVWL